MAKGFFFLLLSCFSGVLHAHESCATALQNFLDELGNVRNDNSDVAKGESRPTVFKKGTVVFSDSENGILVERHADRPWFSTYVSSQIPDSQGNPRAILFLTGDNGTQLGFQMLSDRQLVVPDPTMAAKTSKKLSNKIVQMKGEAIPLSFYPQKVPLAENYVRTFGNELALPLADPEHVRKDGSENFNHYIHDLSFHYPSIGFPPRDLKVMGEKARYATHLADAILQNPEVEAVLGAKLEENKKMYMITQAADIDILTAQLGTILLKPDLTTMGRSTQYVYDKLYNPEYSSENFVKQYFKRLFATFPSPQKETLAAALDTSLKKATLSYEPIHTKPFPPPKPPSYDQFCLDIRTRREEIRSALGALAADPATNIQIP